MIGLDRPEAAATGRAAGRGPALGWLVRLIAAVALAALVTLLASRLIPQQLHITTDIVGYPIYNDFNAPRLTFLYYLGVLLFPLLSIALYLALTRLSRHPVRPAAREAPAGAGSLDAEPGGWTRTAAVSRVLAVGAVLGLETAIVTNASGLRFWLTEAGTMFGYALAVAGIAAAIHRGLARSRAMMEISRVNALASPLAIVGLHGVSANTTVTVSSSGSLHHYAWLPWWVAAVLALATLAILWRQLALAPSEAEVGQVERRAVRYVAAPVGLFLLLSALPGALGPMDVFHEGERLEAAQLVSSGSLFWRDVISTHGLLEDGVFPLLGLRLVEPTRWGDVAGQTLFLIPLFFVSLYLLAAWAFQRSWPFLAAIGVAIVGSQLMLPVMTRYLLWPLLLVLLGAVLHQGRWWLGAALGVGLVAQAVLVPELAYCIPAAGLVLVLYETVHRRPATTLVFSYARSVWCVSGGALALLGFAAFLALQHGLGDLLLYYRIFAPGHALTGGMPVALHSHLHDPQWLFVVGSPIAAVLAGSAYFAAKALRGQPLDVTDWVMAASGIFALVFYTRFLDRADLGHAFLSYNAALPLIALLVFRLVSGLDGATQTLMRRLPQGVALARPASLALLGVTLLVFAAPLIAQLSQSVNRLQPVVAAAPQIAGLGYSDGGLEISTYRDLRQVLNAYLRPGDWVFDFSNEPGLIYYLLGIHPRTRYFHISMAIPEAAQQDLIGQLEQHPPRLVIFNNDVIGLPGWDRIPTSVRHYDVSQYILDHYRPLLSTHTQLIYGLTSANLSPNEAAGLPLDEPIVTDNLYDRAHACDWGYALNFLRTAPPGRPGGARPVSVQQAAAGNGLLLSPPTGESWSGYRWLEITTRSGFAADRWTLSDMTSGDSDRQIVFRTLPSGPARLRVPVGSCAQWHGYPATNLYLAHALLEKIDGVTLVP